MDDLIQVVFDATPTVKVGFSAIVPEEVVFQSQEPVQVEFEDVDDQ